MINWQEDAEILRDAEILKETLIQRDANFKEW